MCGERVRGHVYGDEHDVFDIVGKMEMVDLGGNSAAFDHSGAPPAALTARLQADCMCTSYMETDVSSGPESIGGQTV